MREVARWGARNAKEFRSGICDDGEEMGLRQCEVQPGRRLRWRQWGARRCGVARDETLKRREGRPECEVRSVGNGGRQGGAMRWAVATEDGGQVAQAVCAILEGQLCWLRRNHQKERLKR